MYVIGLSFDGKANAPFWAQVPTGGLPREPPLRPAAKIAETFNKTVAPRVSEARHRIGGCQDVDARLRARQSSPLYLNTSRAVPLFAISIFRASWIRSACCLV